MVESFAPFLFRRRFLEWTPTSFSLFTLFPVQILKISAFFGFHYSLFSGIELPTDAMYKLPSLGFANLPSHNGWTGRLMANPDKLRLITDEAFEKMPDPLNPRVNGAHPKLMPNAPSSSFADSSRLGLLKQKGPPSHDWAVNEAPY